MIFLLVPLPRCIQINSRTALWDVAIWPSLVFSFYGHRPSFSGPYACDSWSGRVVLHDLSVFFFFYESQNYDLNSKVHSPPGLR